MNCDSNIVNKLYRIATINKFHAIFQRCDVYLVCFRRIQFGWTTEKSQNMRIQVHPGLSKCFVMCWGWDNDPIVDESSTLVPLNKTLIYWIKYEFSCINTPVSNWIYHACDTKTFRSVQRTWKPSHTKPNPVHPALVPQDKHSIFFCVTFQFDKPAYT